jgi:hypothetical protein
LSLGPSREPLATGNCAATLPPATECTLAAILLQLNLKFSPENL